jgi:hypothetical protein
MPTTPPTPPPDPILGPLPPNQRQQLPRLYNGGATNLTFVRSHHLDGTIPTYWGPNQDAPEYDEDGNAIYTPPANWPRKGTILRCPRVARWFWEAASVDYEVVVACGVTGAYTFGQHYLDYATDITIAGTGGPYPVHIAGHTLDQYGVSAYGTPFSIYGSGSFVTQDWTANGVYHYDYWIYSGYLPPISMKQYEDRTSETYLAIKLVWDLEIGGFTPAIAHQPAGTEGIPAMDTNQTGPFNVGLCYPVKTGIYWINNIQYGVRADPDTLGLTIPIGWAMPPEDPDHGEDSASNWGELSDFMNAQYLGSTNPYFNAFPMQNPDEFIDIVTPTQDGFFACQTVNFILLSQVHPLPGAGDDRVKRIKTCYPHMSLYVVVMLVDTQNLQDQATAGDGEAASFASEVASWVGGMPGFFYETVSYLDPANVQQVIERYIKTYLHPELKDAPPDDANPGGFQGADDGKGDGDGGTFVMMPQTTDTGDDS